MAREKYHVFHIITKPLNSTVTEKWFSLLPDGTALVDEKNVKNLYMVIISIMQLVKGQDREEIIDQWPKEARYGIRSAIERIRI
jgi:hypothetical protein